MDTSKKMNSAITRFIVSALVLIPFSLVWFSYEDPAVALAPYSFTPLPLIPIIAFVVLLHSLFTIIALKFSSQMSFLTKELTWWQAAIALIIVITILNYLE